jgi:hypothetical protein
MDIGRALIDAGQGKRKSENLIADSQLKNHVFCGELIDD